jgi:PKHD-type hydroxylase
MDTCLGTNNLPEGMIQPRKLSFTLLLNDDFEGGEFMVNLGNENDAIHVEIPKGRLIAFPSFIIHSVKPVTKGFRKSIVIWVSGPKFR